MHNPTDIAHKTLGQGYGYSGARVQSKVDKIIAQYGSWQNIYGRGCEHPIIRLAANADDIKFMLERILMGVTVLLDRDVPRDVVYFSKEG